MDDDAVTRAIIRYGVRRLERLLSTEEGRASLIGADGEHTTWTISSGEDDMAALFGPVRTKRCEWQVEEGRDLFCAAATHDDHGRIARLGARGIAPTTPSICEACGTPDEEWLCSAWSHPDVRALGTMGARWNRQLVAS